MISNIIISIKSTCTSSSIISSMKAAIIITTNITIMVMRSLNQQNSDGSQTAKSEQGTQKGQQKWNDKTEKPKNKVYQVDAAAAVEAVARRRRNSSSSNSSSGIRSHHYLPVLLQRFNVVTISHHRPHNTTTLKIAHQQLSPAQSPTKHPMQGVTSLRRLLAQLSQPPIRSAFLTGQSCFDSHRRWFCRCMSWHQASHKQRHRMQQYWAYKHARYPHSSQFSRNSILPQEIR